MVMKNTRATSLIILLLMSLSFPLAALAKAPMNRIVAIVDKGIILQSQLDEQIKQMYQRIPVDQRASISRKDIQSRVLEQMIITELQLQIARRSQIQIPEAELDAAIGRVANSNKLSPEQFKNVLEKDGVSLADFRKSIRDQLLVRRVQSSFVHHEVKISQQEVDSFLKLMEQNDVGGSSEYHLGHILISTPENATPEQVNKAKQKANEVANSLNAGQRFATVSIAKSDANNALEGGDLGWMKQAQMPSLLAPYVKDMQDGDISPVIQSPSGFHIIKLFETRGQEKVMVTKTHARHILIKINALISDNIAKDRLITLKTRIENGEEFTPLARANSDDRGSAIKGGDLGWVEPGALVPAFEAAMNKLDINQLSEPVQTQFGWHLIQVLGREQKDNSKLMREAQARSQLRKRKADAAINAWLVKLRDEAYVEYRIQN